MKWLIYPLGAMIIGMAVLFDVAANLKSPDALNGFRK